VVDRLREVILGDDWLETVVSILSAELWKGDGHRKHDLSSLTGKLEFKRRFLIIYHGFFILGFFQLLFIILILQHR